MYYSRPKPFLKKLGFLALFASIIVLVQICIILTQGDPLCLNQGCEIVEQLNKVPPLFFNLAGFVFFLIIYWGVRMTNRGSSSARALVLVLLTAGMGAEAVLVGFQYLIACTFCSYCLFICACIFLLNILAGWRQALRGLVVFCAVAAAFFSLDFRAPAEQNLSYQDGIIATRQGTQAEPQLHLFFSSTCSHCENIIQLLAPQENLTVALHPIDAVEAIDMPGIKQSATYSTAANRNFLASLGINEVPVLLLEENEQYSVYQGERIIQQQINKLTMPQGKEESKEEQNLSQTSSQDAGLNMSSDGCSVEENCEDGTDLIPSLSAP